MAAAELVPVGHGRELPFTGSEAIIFRVNELCFCATKTQNTKIEIYLFIYEGEADKEQQVRGHRLVSLPLDGLRATTVDLIFSQRDPRLDTICSSEFNRPDTHHFAIIRKDYTTTKWQWNFSSQKPNL